MKGTKASEASKDVKKKKVHSKKPTNNIDHDIESLLSKYDKINIDEINTFKEMPLCGPTIKGLNASGYTIPTKIQKESIGLALQKFDILGAAKTGSGKTLAFLIPLLESLYCYKWTKLDGLGALIITPTRELALQIFETLRNIGRHHDFSASLIIGGKDLKFERSRMDTMNIIVCTPGRLLQHMDENPLFNCDNLKVLILDEADRCLDMGFETTMNAIIENLPKGRQTLLFSATQTRSVRDLARLSLKDPKYISVHENDKHKTPEGLVQSYIICEQHEKITVLWSFITSHLQNKILVFLATCHEVRFVQEMFKYLHPRITLLALHSKMHQLKRMEVYKTFCSKKHAVLFATDIASRGLDFPEVHWVVQLDCPEDVETYIHRAGRTARYHKGGESLLVLRPAELSFIDDLNSSKIPINQIKVNPAKMMSPLAKIEALLAKQVQFKEMAQRAFVSYVKSVFLMKNKAIFNVKSINLAEFSRSLGLAVCPRVRFLKKHLKSTDEASDKKMSTEKLQKVFEGDQESYVLQEEVNKDSEDEDAHGSRNVHSDSHEQKTSFDFGLDEDDDDFLTIKRKDHELADELQIPEDIANFKKSKKVKPKAMAKKILKKKLVVNTKIVFGEDGDAITDARREKVTDIGKTYDMNTLDGGIDIQEAKKVMKEEDKCDKVLFREKIREKKRELKRKRKEKLGLLKKKDNDDDENVDEYDEESDSSGPDLSWLPDPDKIYNKADKSSENDSDNDEEIPKKRIKASYDDDEVSESDDNVSLKDEEEFALHLLSSNK